MKNFLYKKWLPYKNILWGLENEQTFQASKKAKTINNQRIQLYHHTKDITEMREIKSIFEPKIQQALEKNKKAFDFLAQTAITGEQVDHRYAAIQSLTELAKQGMRETLPYLKKATKDTIPINRFWAIQGLYNLSRNGEKEALAAIIEIAEKNADPSTQNRAIYRLNGLAELGIKDAVKGLSKLAVTEKRFTSILNQVVNLAKKGEVDTLTALTEIATKNPDNNKRILARSGIRALARKKKIKQLKVILKKVVPKRN
ncbi:MAG: HEAT repeat domain-containing protein [archaeon]|jgi:predicted secreted protein